MKKNTDKSNLNEEIIKRLDAIVSILLSQEEAQQYKQGEKIDYLAKMKFKNPEIAFILNTTLKTVEAYRYKKPKGKTNE